MTRTALSYIFLAIILVLAQVIVFNHVSLFGVAIPFVFIYLICHLPLTLSTNWVLTIGFLLGLTVDIFSDTQGLNALGCTVISGLRHGVLKLYFPREEDMADSRPTIRTLGIGVFVRYVLTLSFIYCTIVLLADSFTFFDPIRLLIGIAASTLLTTILLIALDYLISK
ncbi:MAG: rod shape-determining protein MreD [Muribaculaceae bacterium]|nr:rod shape-determining protein MreD [Muribaculaceae bacterium]